MFVVRWRDMFPLQLAHMLLASRSTSRIQIFSARSRRRRCRSSSSRNPIWSSPSHRPSPIQLSGQQSPSPEQSATRPTPHVGVGPDEYGTSTNVRGSLEDMFPLQLAHMLSASTSTSTSLLGSSTRGNLPRRRSGSPSS